MDNVFWGGGGRWCGLVWNSGIPYSINKGGREIEIVQQEESVETEEWRSVLFGERGTVKDKNSSNGRICSLAGNTCERGFSARAWGNQGPKGGGISCTWVPLPGWPQTNEVPSGRGSWGALSQHPPHKRAPAPKRHRLIILFFSPSSTIISV